MSTMSRRTKKETVVDGSAVNEKPAYVKELLEKGAVVLTGRTPDELAEMVDNIPADCSYSSGAVTKYLDKGLYRIQINLNQIESN